MTQKLLYFADPMCSWCWGFEPVMKRLRDAVGDQIPVEVFVGGLRPFTEHVMTDKDKSYVRNHWNHVEEASGQPFDYGLFERDDFTYDTEPACRALVTVRKIAPDLAHDMLNALHAAFYKDGKDTTDADVLSDIAATIGVTRTEFQIMFEADETKAETLADFQFTQRAGISGFPTLVGVQEGTQPVALTMGFQPWDGLKPIVESWLGQSEAIS